MIQSEMKETLIEIRESTVERVKLRIKSMIWNIRKKKQPIKQEEEKRIQKNKDRVNSL